MSDPIRTMAFYQEHDLGNDGEWDNWRIEGPSFVWYYRGFPHVHVWIHRADDPQTPVTSHFGCLSSRRRFRSFSVS